MDTNVKARASRALVRRGCSAAILAGSLAVATASCGTVKTPSVDEAAAPPTAAATASTPAPEASTSTSSENPDEKYTVADADVQQDALDTFGRERVLAGYKQAIDLAEKFTYRDTRLAPRDFTMADFAEEKSYMTPATAQEWEALVAKALAGDEEEQANMQALTAWNADTATDNLTFRPDGPKAVNRRISGITVSVDRTSGADRLQVHAVMEADLRMNLDGRPLLLPLSRDTDYFLVPADAGQTPGGRGWLLETWNGTFAPGKGRLDTGQ